jgi:starch-binding outer membrane protein, SusD/RagB family
MKSHFKYIWSVVVLLAFGCEKFVEVPPPVTQVSGNLIYESDASAIAGVFGIYRSMANSSAGGGSNGLSAVLGLSADEFQLFPTTNILYNEAYSNSLQSNSNTSRIWSSLFNTIYQCNYAIEKLEKSVGVTSDLKQHLVGEVKFIRALCYFYSVNIFGSTPISLTSDWKINSTLERSSPDVLYEQVVSDLLAARDMLSIDFLSAAGSPTTERLRATKAAADALLARVYLYQRAWDKAEAQATLLIDDPRFFLDGIENVFSKFSSEAIWQLQPADVSSATPDGRLFLGRIQLTGRPSSSNPILMSPALVNDFDSADLRRSNWIGSLSVGNSIFYYPYKYKLGLSTDPPDEYIMVLRLAEQYLIRSEARAQQDNLQGALSDLNFVRSRANVPAINMTSKQEILQAILKERRLELFSEYGHRWLDLKRSASIDTIMVNAAVEKGGIWNATDALYPIPASDILANPNMTQNDGYN